jgi:adenylate cyclase
MNGLSRATGAPTMIGRSDVERQLERLLVSAQLAAAPRMQSLLKYLVNAALDGDGERLKGYSIGIDVFDRPDEFDPRLDSIVRVQAGRLRKILEQYYEGEGARDPVRIVLPKGAYTPLFSSPDPSDSPPVNTSGETDEDDSDAEPAAEELAAAAAGLPPPLLPPLEPPPQLEPVETAAPDPPPGAAPFRPFRNWTGPAWAPGVALAVCALLIVGAVAWLGQRPDPATVRPSGPVVYVAQYRLIDEAPLTRQIRDGLQFELIDRLSRYPDLGVLGIDTVAGADGDDALRAPRGADFVLSGSVQSAGGELQVFSQLIRASDGAVEWSDQARGGTTTAASILNIQSGIATDVAAQLGQPYGVIQEAMTRELDNGRDIAMSDYVCVLSAYEYAREKSEARHGAVRDCLESVVVRSPNYASAWALLSWNYGDEKRFGFNIRADGSSPTDRAMEAARRAVQANPTSAMAYQYLAIAMYETGDTRGFRAAADRSLTLNPNSSEILADVGLRLIQLDGSDRGLQMAEKALALNPGAPPWYHAGPAIYALEHGDREQALVHARAYSVERGPFSKFLLAAAWRLNGEPEKAEEVLEELKSINPAAVENARRTISNLRLSDKVAKLVFGPDWT